MATKTRFDQDYWQRHLDLWRQSGQTQTEYCASAGLNAKSFSRWKSLLPNPKAQKGSSAHNADKEISLIPVRLASPDPVGPRLDAARDIRIRFDNSQWIVDVPEGVDSIHLANVLKAIAGAAQ